MLMARLVLMLLLALLISGILFAIVSIVRMYLMSKTKEKVGEKPMDAGLRDLISEGRIDEAIEIYQRFTGIDEVAARDYVRNIAREIRLSDETYQAVQRILKADGKAAAIEVYQEQAGASLAEALDYVEKIEKREK